MAVYTPGRRTHRWVGPLAVLMVLAVLALAALWLVQASRQSPQERVALAADRISSQLDVLRLSLYTPEVVKDGRVTGPQEYSAAVEAVSQVRSEWAQVEPLVEPTQAEGITRGLDQLQSLVQNKQPPEEVERLAKDLMVQVRSLTARK